MSDDVTMSAGGYALAAFQLNRAIMTALIDKKLVTRREMHDAIGVILQLGGKMPGREGSEAEAHLRGVQNGFAENDRD